MSSGQESRHEMTEADAHAFMTRLAERLGVSVEQLTSFSKKGENGELVSSENMQGINETIKHLSLNRRQRRKANKKNGNHN
jgi:Mn-dependent DtxR family transcriptional regulator